MKIRDILLEPRVIGGILLLLVIGLAIHDNKSHASVYDMDSQHIQINQLDD